MRLARTTSAALLVGALVLTTYGETAAQGRRGRMQGDTTPTLGLDQGFVSFDTPALELKLVKASQTAAGLQPKGADGFDFTPSDWLERRAANGYHHLGDLDLRLRVGSSGEWKEYATDAERKPVRALDAEAPVLAAADLAPTLPADIPLDVRRSWEVHDGHLVLRFELKNTGDQPVQIGALGIPMIFDNILSGRSLDEAHHVASFYDPYIGEDAGYLQVTRLSGHGPALVVVPYGKTPFEAYNPLLNDRTRRSNTFEGFYEWMVHSQAYAENEWKDAARPWNPPTSETLAPGESRSYGVEFLVSPEIRDIEKTLMAAKRPVAVGVPGYIVPTDLDVKLFLKSPSKVQSMQVDPAGALTVTPAGTTPGGWPAYDVRGHQWGRARLTVTYADGMRQAIQYKVIKSESQVVADLGHFLLTKQWYVNPKDPFHRSPSVISYDYEAGRQVTQDNRAWIAGLSDEGGAGSWLAAIMKQLVEPDSAQVAQLQQFVDGVLWGGLQYDRGDEEYGVRKSMFYYAPDSMPPGTYSDSIGYGGWSSWNKKEAMSTNRSYNYLHVAAAYWVLYRLARDHQGIVTDHPWEWFLDRAYRTGLAMEKFAPHYAQFGQMEGTVYVLILEDLKREGWTEQAAEYEAVMRKRAEVWRSLAYPFGSEMPWDSTGQEEVYAWCRYFGFDAKAEVTLNAILGYMPTVPNWGYNGSARRYWDFQYAGKLRRIERQLHHYGSGLNAIPVLSEYRRHPDDLYLLRVGYGGLMGSIANVTEDGFGPSAFHSFPSTMRIDGLSGDYGPNFFGHAINTGTYVVHDPDLGWLAFGGNLTTNGSTVSVKPLDSARRRLYVASLGLWVTLDAGTIQGVEIRDGTVRLTLSPADRHTARAILRVSQPAQVQGVGTIGPAGSYSRVRGAYAVPLGSGTTEVVLRSNG